VERRLPYQVIFPDDHNALVDVAADILDWLKFWGFAPVEYEAALGKLRRVQHGDFVLHSDVNDLRDALVALRDFYAVEGWPSEDVNDFTERINAVPVVAAGELVRAAHRNVLIDAWEKASQMSVAPPRDVILLAIQKHLGVFWFNNNWSPAGMISSTTSGTATIAWVSDYVELDTGTTVNSYAVIWKDAWGLSGGGSWGKKRYFGVYVRLETISAQIVHIVTGLAPSLDVPNPNPHIGFKLIDNKLYGTVGNGTEESTLLLETLEAGVWRRLECVLDPEVPECRFFVDGVDKGAITTNLPTGTSYARRMLRASICTTEAASKILRLYESRTLQME